MRTPLRPIRRSAALALALFASMLSCGREVTGPGGRGALVSLQMAPDFSAMVDSVGGVAYSVAGLVPFSKVRIELRRVDNSVAASAVVDFPADATEIPLSIDVRLGAAATNGAEPLTAFLRYINTAGDTVFAGGPVPVTAKAGASSGEEPPVQIPVAPTVPGAVFASVDISPDSAVGAAGSTLTFTATGYDTQNAVVSNAIIGFLSRNPAIAAVPNLGQGTVNLVGARGETWIVAQSLTGLRDSAHVKIIPVPSQIAKAGGDAQTALQATVFAQPLRVRVLASDNLPVAGATVTFAVTEGGGTLSATTAQTDADGFASVIWTAGSTLGQGAVVASVGTPAITTTFTGTQVNAGPTSLLFETEPVAIVAGDTLPPIRVAVRNALGQTITSFTGAVSLSRVGTGGGRLVGDTIAAAVAGVATFRGLTVDRAGTDYRLVAILPNVPNQLSSVFVVTAAPPVAVQLVSGGGQFSEPGTVLPAPIVVRVVDRFQNPMPGITVTFTVQSGGGSVSPASAPTGATGQASTQWTLGSGDLQQLRITAGTVPALLVTAELPNQGGPPVLFAGYDSTLVRIGQSRSVPLHLSTRVDTAVTVTLTTNATGLQWATGSTQFASRSRETKVDLSVAPTLLPGTYWAYATSAAGNDSIKIRVDSAFVMFPDPYTTTVAARDTVHIPLRLSDPAPTGGVTVRVKSASPRLAQVIAGTGAGTPVWGCLDAQYCYYGALQTTTGAAGDSVDITIPAGEMLGHAAFIVRDTVATGALVFSATAPTHKASSVQFTKVTATLGVLGTATSAEGVGVGQYSYGVLSYNAGEASRERKFRLRSLTPSIFSVDSAVVIPQFEFQSTSFSVRGLAAGVGQLEYGNAEVGYDTATVRIRAPRFVITPSGTSVAARSTFQLYIQVAADTSTVNSGTTRAAADVPISVVSRNRNVVEVDQAAATLLAGDYSAAINLRSVGTGTAYVVLSSPGYRTDSVAVTVSGGLLTVDQAARSIGVNTSMRWTLRYQGRSGDFGPPRTLEARPRRVNAPIARVRTPQVEISEGTFGTAIFDVIGLAIGVDTMDFLFGDTVVASFPYSVNQPRLRLQLPTSVIEPDSGFRYVANGIVTDSALLQRAAVDTLRAILRSSDPTVLRVVDSTITLRPGEAFSDTSQAAAYVALRAGTATLHLTAAGFTSDSVVLTVQPYQLFVTSGSTTSANVAAGIGTLSGVSVRRNSPVADTLPLTITHQGPGRVEFVRSVVGIPRGSELIFEYFTGVTAGVDTVIFAAANHAPDTLIATVFASRARLSALLSVQGGQLDDDVFARFNVSEGTLFTPSQTRRFRVVSRDTTKARVEQDTIIVPSLQGAPRYAAVRYQNPGSVWLVMTDLDAAYAPDSVQVTIRPRQLYGWTDWEQHYLPIGTRQRSYSNNMFVELDYRTDKDVWVRFSTSRPGLVALPDSVRIPAGEAYTTFNLAAGDTVGAVRVTASVPGFNPWEFDVAVTRTRLELYPDFTYVGAPANVYVDAVDALEGYARPLAVATTLSLTSDRPDIVSVTQSNITFPADSEYVFVRALRGETVGSTLLRIADTRTDAFSSFAPDAREVEVYRPALIPAQTQYLASQGLQTTTSGHYVEATPIRDSVWVRLTSKAGRFSPTADSVLMNLLATQPTPELGDALHNTAAFGLRGITAGVDTLVFSAAGFPSAEAQVRIERGILQVPPDVPTIVYVGDSALVRVNFAGADGALGAATTGTTAFSYGFVGVPNPASITVPAGSTTASFWVKASAAGQGTFEITSDSFRPLRITFEARTRP